MHEAAQRELRPLRAVELEVELQGDSEGVDRADLGGALRNVFDEVGPEILEGVGPVENA